MSDVAVTTGTDASYRFVPDDDPGGFTLREVRRQSEWTLLAAIEFEGTPGAKVSVLVPDSEGQITGLIVDGFSDPSGTTEAVRDDGKLRFDLTLDAQYTTVLAITFTEDFPFADYVDSLRPRAAVLPPDFGAEAAPAPAPEPAPEPGLVVEGGGGPPQLEFAQIGASMPAEVQVRTPVTVTVSLSRGELVIDADAARDVKVIVVNPAKPVVVKILHEQFDLVGRSSDVRTLLLPPAGKTKSVFFRVAGVSIGEGVIQIVVRQDSAVPLATLRLTSRIRSRLLRKPAGRQRAHSSVAPHAPQFLAPNSLVIDENRVGPASQLTFDAYLEGVPRASFTRVLPDKAATLDRLFTAISNAWDATEHDADRSTPFMAALKRLGADAARDILPPGLPELLRHNIEAVSHLAIVTSGETDVPWEVFFVGDPATDPDTFFLGRAGLVRWIYNTDHPKNLAAGRGRSWFLCPEYRNIPALDVSAEADALGGVGAQPVLPPTPRGLTALLKTDFDLLHFGGHGATDEGRKPTQRLLFADYAQGAHNPPSASITVEQVKKVLASNRLGDESTGPLVVLNACRVGRPPTGRAELGSFAEAFLRGGAGAFLGCLWSVDDAAARTFVLAFYEALASNATIGEATVAARAAALTVSDASWLAYTVYAHPDATVAIDEGA